MAEKQIREKEETIWDNLRQFELFFFIREVQSTRQSIRQYTFLDGQALFAEWIQSLRRVSNRN